MALIKESFEKETLEAWRTYTATLEKSLETVENGKYDASEISA
jgi:hypothetical protein